MRRRYLRYKMRRNIGKARGAGELAFMAAFWAFVIALVGAATYTIANSLLHLTGVSDSVDTCRYKTPTGRLRYDACEPFNYALHLIPAVLVLAVLIVIYRESREA